MVAFADTLAEAVETYNRYRSPTATVTLLDAGDERFRVRFEGAFATTCCRDDYFDDLRYELQTAGMDADDVAVEAIRRVGLEAFEVTFAVAPDATA